MIVALLKDLMSTARRLLSGTPGAAVGEITAVLTSGNPADPIAQEKLMALVYPELKRIAQGRMRSERSDHTLQPTALVNEFYLHFARLKGVSWKNRAHFLAVASNAMRRVLIDCARSHNSSKRGGGVQRIQFDVTELGACEPFFDLLEINELLDELASEEPRMARVVELRYFGGLTNAEIGEVLGIDERTVKRDWQVARAWLFGHLNKGG